MNLKDFDFDLPEELIAKYPLTNRQDSRMLVVPPIADNFFKNFPDFLNAGDVLVLNDTKVIPSRIYGISNGKNYEITLHKEERDGVWLGFTKSKKLAIGDKIIFNDELSADVEEKSDKGVLLNFNETRENLLLKLEKYGKMPLPPYMKREEEESDKTRYQTVFAKHSGSVAAPTASLHFTNEILKKIEKKGVKIVYITLHVGAGTFLPVKTDDLSKHIMHSEFGIVSKDAANTINEAKKNGGKITAVGTTVLRLLESASDCKDMIHEFCKSTDIFITPGYKFKCVDQLLTNFHTPCSTLFMLVCAFAGYNEMKKAYAHAISEKYRFYSYGDCCLLTKQ